MWVRQLLRKVWRIDPGCLGLELARPESLVTTDKRALVVINDASCLIDLRKGALLDVLVHLPYQLVIPLPVRLSEVLDFSAQDWAILDHRGNGHLRLAVRPSNDNRALRRFVALLKKRLQKPAQ